MHRIVSAMLCAGWAILSIYPTKKWEILNFNEQEEIANGIAEKHFESIDCDGYQVHALWGVEEVYILGKTVLSKGG